MEAFEKVKNEVLTFERDGLGVSGMERNSIELVEGARVFKDRPYSMQKRCKSVDLKFAFWQIESEDNSKECTPFPVSRRPLYHYRTKPYVEWHTFTCITDHDSLKCLMTWTTRQMVPSSTRIPF
ncbi:GD17663 [Drosophila simulans]|uniref:GD17663 n=1 Tax=Drosophila simulans TaxID=7240 RepID=B4NSW2_DROSI|nr:GD17663 [Drosophila simulans]